MQSSYFTFFFAFLNLFMSLPVGNFHYDENLDKPLILPKRIIKILGNCELVFNGSRGETMWNFVDYI